MTRIKFSFAFSFIALALAILVLANLLSDKIYSLFPLPIYAIPVGSIVLSFLILFVFWRNHKESELIKNEFMTIVTHKFRTPLTGIGWIAEAMRGDITSQEKEDYISQLRRANNKLEEIVDLLVNFTKFDKRLEYAYKAVAPHELIEEALKNSAQNLREKQIQMSVDSTSTLPMIVIDQMKLQFVIDILIDNAIKYTPPGGSIAIKAWQSNERVYFAVEDSGIGIRPEDLNRVTKRFFRTKGARKMDTEGLGLGLYMARTIVERHGGRLSIESKGENQGTKVSFSVKKH